MVKNAYISFGSNLGNRVAMLNRAIKRINSSDLRVVRQSSHYLTEPVDGPPQAWFLNVVLEVQTSLLPLQLLHRLLRIERELGRKRVIYHGPRVVDLDILFYGTSIIHSHELDVPHPKLPERRFVLVPLAEIAPELRHPGLKKSIAELLVETPDRSEVRKASAPNPRE